MGNELVWIAFLALFLTLLVLDLSVLHREATEMSVRQALFWTLIWVSVALSFTAAVYSLYEHRWLNFDPGPGVETGTDAGPQDGADFAFGGAGRDILLGNAASDRLTDWVGEFNNYYVPFNPFGQSTVIRQISQSLPEFLYAVSKSDGAASTSRRASM